MSCSRLLLFVLFSLPFFEAASQNPGYFEKYTTASGLSSNDVNILLVDHAGFLWIGTTNGLNRFDGNNFRLFPDADRPSSRFTSNYITALLEDSEHHIWVGTL